MNDGGKLQERVKGHVRGKLLRATLAVFLLTAATVLSVAAWLHAATERERLLEMEQQVGASIASKAKVLVDNQALALTGLVADNASSDVQALVARTVAEDPDLVYGLFVDRDGNPWAYASGRSQRVPLSPAEVLARWTEITPPESGWLSHTPTRRRTAPFGAEVFEVGRPVFESGVLLGTIRYGFSTSALEKALASVRAKSERTRQRSLAWLLLSVAACTVFGVLVIARTARRITEPLEQLTRAAHDIAQGQLGVRVKVESEDELELLAGAFNHMQVANEKGMERLRAAMDAALEASQLKSEFLANMSHEIRTPMNGVLGMLQLMRGQPLDAKLRRYVETADASAGALMTIINDVLDFSKMEAGKYELQSVEFDPGAVLQEVAELFAGRAHEKGIELVYQRTAGVPQGVVGDPDRYRQVLSNLVGNAVKFTPSGEIYVEVSLRARTDDAIVLFTSVQDTGIGIAREDQDMLFDAFSQVDGSSVREHGGTGLGLAICRRLTDMMSGSIGVVSERGKGSTFWFDIRVGVASSAQPSRVPPLGKRALVIETNPRWCGVIAEHLRQWGVTGECFQHGLPALEHLARADAAAFDVAIVSQPLADVPAGVFMRRLRQTAAGARLPLVVLTHVGEQASIAEWEVEVAAQLPKPLRVAELYQALLVIFDGAGAGVAVHRGAACPQPSSTAPIVMVVDDNDINRFVASEQLELAGYRVVSARNGVEAIEKLHEQPLAAVLMDCQMPVMDGYTAARRIRELEGDASHVPIIALTAHAMIGEREKVLAAGMDDYLAKPLQPHSLERMLARHVRGDPAADPSSRVQPTAPDPDAMPEELEDLPRSQKLVQLFLDHMPEQLDELAAAIRSGDAELTRQRAHKIKGGCLAVGAAAMARIAEELQHVPTHQIGSVAERDAALLRQRFANVAGLLRRSAPTLPPRSMAPEA